MGKYQCLKMSSACGFSFGAFWDVSPVTILVKNQNLFPPCWSLLCCSHPHSGITSKKLQAINSTGCSPLLQLCLGNAQPCQALSDIFPLFKARPRGSHIKLLFCPPPVMLERIFLNQNQMSCLPSSEKNQCKLIAKPKSLSLTFPRTRTFIYLLLRYTAQLCKQWTLLNKLINLQLISKNCLMEKTELFLQS